MSTDCPKDELPPGMIAGEYVQLEVGEFQKAYATMLHVVAGKLPTSEGFEPGPQTVPGLGTFEVEDTPYNRGMHTGASLFSDAAKRQSFHWRAVVVMGVAGDKKYRKYRKDETGTMHIALLTTVCMVRGSSRTPKKAYIIFRQVLKAAKDWAEDNPGHLQCH